MEPVVLPRTIESMPAHARVWVYKSAKPFTPEQRRAILDRGLTFTSGWAAHGAALDACVDVLHDHFVVIAVDEQQAMASGCGIDKSVRLVQELERDLGVHLTDRMVVLYDVPQGIAACRVPEVEGLIKRGELHADSIVYDDLLNTCGELRARFRGPLSATWLARYL
jgi:hypothetical protein